MHGPSRRRGEVGLPVVVATAVRGEPLSHRHLRAELGDLSAVRVGNRGPETTVDVRLVGLDAETTANATVDRRGVTLPTNNDLAVLVTDWEDLSMEVRTVPFET